MKLKNKNLLIMTNGYPSKDGLASHTFVKEQVDAIKDKFNKVYVISPTPYFPKFLAKFDFVPQFFKQQTKFYDYSYDNVEVYYPKFFTVPLDFIRKRNGDFAYKTSLKCIQKNDIDFDLIHSHFTWTSGYVGNKLKERFNTKHIITGHGFDVYKLPFKSDYRKEKISSVLQKADNIITVSESNSECLQKLGRDNVNIIPNGYSLNKFNKKDNISQIKNELNINHNKKILLNVANLKPIKNQINLIKAINELLKERKDIVLYLIGGGNDRDKIENKIQELNLQNYIKVLGGKPHDEIPLWMNIADLFVLPSYSEGNPTVMFEALGCGLPYVGTDVGGVGEIITSDNYGLIYNNPDDFEKLSSLINEGLNKKWDIDKILDYSKKYSWERICDRIVKQYKKVLQI